MRQAPFIRRPSPSLVISCVALFIALGSAGYAATGQSFILGQGNSADATSVLSSDTALGPTLRIRNLGGQSAAAFVTDAGVPPFTVNRGQKVANLNADRLDSIDSASLLQTSTLAGGDLGGTFDNLQIGADTIGSAEVANGSLGSDEIANETITTFDIQSNAVQTDEIQDHTVGAADLTPGSVGAAAVGDKIVDREDATPTPVPGGTGENGAYFVETSTASCNAGEELVGGYGKWSPDDNASNDYELVISEVRLNHVTESVLVDGGNDSGVDHSLIAVATCLIP